MINKKYEDIDEPEYNSWDKILIVERLMGQPDEYYNQYLDSGATVYFYNNLRYFINIQSASEYRVNLAIINTLLLIEDREIIKLKFTKFNRDEIIFRVANIFYLFKIKMNVFSSTRLQNQLNIKKMGFIYYFIY